MPAIYKQSENGIIQTQGVLKDAIQFHDEIMVATDLAFSCPLSVTLKEPKKENAQPNSYILRKKIERKIIGLPKVRWVLYYVDPNGKQSQIEIDSINRLSNVLTNLSTKEIQSEDIYKIKSIIATHDVKNRDNNIGNFVGVGNCKKGKFVITDSLSPCQGVIVRFKNGESVIYHATSAKESKGFDDFLSLIKKEKRENIVDIIVFQKSQPIANLLKAPILALTLDRHLNSESESLKIEIKRIHIDNHTCMLSLNNQIVLANKVAYFDSNEVPNINDLSPNAKGYDDVKFISIEQSIAELTSESNQVHKDEYFRNPNVKH